MPGCVIIASSNQQTLPFHKQQQLWNLLETIEDFFDAKIDYANSQGRFGMGKRVSDLPAQLSNELFAGAEVVRLPADQVLFRAGGSADGCYRVED